MSQQPLIAPPPTRLISREHDHAFQRPSLLLSNHVLERPRELVWSLEPVLRNRHSDEGVGSEDQAQTIAAQPPSAADGSRRSSRCLGRMFCVRQAQIAADREGSLSLTWALLGEPGFHRVRDAAQPTGGVLGEGAAALGVVERHALGALTRQHAPPGGRGRTRRMRLLLTAQRKRQPCCRPLSARRRWHTTNRTAHTPACWQTSAVLLRPASR